MNLFHQNDYKSALKWSLREKQQQGRRITLTQLAQACRVQKTYLSRVLNKDGHFNSDQLHLACKYLDLKPREKKYISLLHEFERSTLDDRKEAMLQEAKKFQAKAKSTENYTSTETLPKQSLDLLQYHLNPTLQLIHLFLTIPKYAKSPRLLEERLALTRDELTHLLHQLAKIDFIEWDSQKWKVKRDIVHLSRESDVYPYYRILLRTKALEKLQRGGRTNDYSFSGFISVDPKTREQIQERFMEFLKEITPLIKKAPATDVYQINFDLIDW